MTQPPDRAERRVRRAQQQRKRRNGAMGVIALLAIGGVAIGSRLGGSKVSSGPTPSVGHAKTGTAATVNAKPAVTVTTTRLRERNLTTLTAPEQDAAAAAIGPDNVMLLGGLTAADTSRSTIEVVSAKGDRTVGQLPGALHDAAAATLGGSVYLFGGGDGVRQLDQILKVNPKTGVVSAAGRLPAPSSDQSAASIGSTAYIVGGYTGTRWLDTIVAWTPDGGGKVVGHLPSALRYAAVASAGGRLVIAGGSRPDGGASDQILRFDPATGRTTTIGHLPSPTTHGAAAAIGDNVYLIGGRGPTVGTPTDRIVEVNTTTGRVSAGGRLSSPRSDLAAVSLGDRILLAGGKGRSGTISAVTLLTPRTTTTSASVPPNAATTPPRTSNVYAADGANKLSKATQGALERVYVPNSDSGTLDVINPRTYKIVAHYNVGGLPQHVVPDWGLRTLYVNNNKGNSLTPINPRTGEPGKAIAVDDPYNLYFTPNGKLAIVVAERNARLDFRRRGTFHLVKSLPVPCKGVNHIDFAPDSSYFITSCEFSSQLVKVDIATKKVVGALKLGTGDGMPQDVKLSPDGRVFYVADMMAGGVWMVNGDRFTVTGFMKTGAGTHGLYPSRDAKLLYISNRDAGTVSVMSFATRKIVKTWTIPGGTPDMGGVSADGQVLWLSGRYRGEVYALNTRTGKLLARIKVGQGPHGLSVWPQPGRYSLGHTGILR